MTALILVTGTTSLSTDAYIAALPVMQVSLRTTSTEIQLTLTACIVGSALGQIAAGPVSDAHGRRRIVLVSAVAFTLMSAACALATSGWLLIAARAAQGVASGTGTAAGRAMVTDSYVGRVAAAKFGTLTAVALTGPVAAPALGGVLLSLGGWRSVFWFLTVVGVLMIIATSRGLPETLPSGVRHPAGALHAIRRAGELLGDPAFRTPVLVHSLVTAGFFIYIGGSSLVLQTDLGLTPVAYTAVFAVDAITMVAASVGYRILVSHQGPFVIRRVAVWVQTSAVLSLLVVTVISFPAAPSLPLVWGCLAVMTFGLGAFFPSNSAIAQASGSRYAGAASSLSGGLPFLIGAATTPITGLLGSQTVVTMASGMAVLFTASAIVAGVGVRRTSSREPG